MHKIKHSWNYGNLQKDIRIFCRFKGPDRTAALGKLGYKAPSLSAALKN